MNKRIVIAIIIFLPLQIVKAQRSDSGLYIGLDVVKSVVGGSQGSFMVEPVLTYVTPNGTTLNFITGFADFRDETTYSNLEYQSKGFYFKAGVGKFVSRIFETSLNLGYTNFTETGTTTFQGSYYDDFKFKGRQKHELAFLEIQGNFWLPLSEKLYFVPSIRIDVIFKTPEGKYYTPYYAPGVGNLEPFLYNTAITNLQSSFVTGGISGRLIYKIF